MLSQTGSSIPVGANQLTTFGTRQTGSARAQVRAQSLFGLTPRIEARVVVLFAALVLVKLALLAGMTKHLHEIHWRVEHLPVSWLNFAAFFLFVGLFVAGIWSLGLACRQTAVRSIRIINLLILVLGLAFCFITSHSGDKNYLQLVMSGVLRWNALLPYLQLDLFFHKPFLAGWLLAYALIYYGLVRTGRESQVLFWTAGFAGAFALACLGELGNYQLRLLVADGFGLAMLLAWRTGRTLRILWLAVPVVWAWMYWELFKSVTPELAQSTPYFNVLLWGSVVLFGGASLLAWRNGCGRAWLPVVPFLFISFVLIGNSNYPLSDNHSNVLCLALTFPRYFLGEFVIAAALAGLAAAWLRARPHGGLWWVDLASLMLMALALIDFQLSRIMGVRLGWDILNLGDSPRMMWRMATPYLPRALLTFGIVAAVYLLGVRAWLAWRSHDDSSAEPLRWSIGSRFAAASFLILALVGVTSMKSDKAVGQSALCLIQTSPIWRQTVDRPMSPAELVKAYKALGLGDLSRPAPNPVEQPRRDLNVVLVFMESSYNQYLSLFGGKEDTQPLLSKYKDRMELFPNFFSNFAGSIQARFASFTSLYPVQDYNAFTLKRVEVKSLFEVLQNEGWHCSLFYSSSFDYTGFGDFLKHRGIEQMFDADSMPGKDPKNAVSWGLKEEETLAAMKSQIRGYGTRGERFFMTYVPAAPHYPYDSIPERFRKFPRGEFGDYTSLYLSELLYIDWVLASIVDELDATGLLDKTMVIITNDHGEMLGANHGSIGHGWAITPQLANTPLIIMDPAHRGYRLNYSSGSQVDLLPTVLGRLGVAIPQDELYQGHSLDTLSATNRPWAYLNSFRQYGVLVDSEILVGDREGSDGSPGHGLSAFQISNQGARTVFTPATSASIPAISIQEFDRFQANFIRNYSSYRRALRASALASSASKSAN
jgi:arylsulfatase A-like enzyme